MPMLAVRSLGYVRFTKTARLRVKSPDASVLYLSLLNNLLLHDHFFLMLCIIKA